ILLYAMQVASTNMAQMNGGQGKGKDKDKDKDKSKNKKKTSAEPSSRDALPSNEALSEPQSSPSGTIQACEQRSRQVFE
ncbi:MAG: hypothetical protein WBF54_18275, partial [Terriglobales bacterium]